MDRIAPTRRPKETPVGWQSWRDLLFLHWEVDAQRLAATLPKGLKLDTFDGRAFIGVVPFRMCQIRPRWWPRRWAFNFLETNVRTYVCHGDEPGVYFYSLDASSRLAVWAARCGWSLPYYHARMEMRQNDGETEYALHRTAADIELALRYRVGDPLGASAPGTLEHFLLERYLLFTAARGSIWRGQVYHTPYPAHRAELLEIRSSMLQDLPSVSPGQLPHHAHFSPGVDVEIFRLCRV